VKEEPCPSPRSASPSSSGLSGPSGPSPARDYGVRQQRKRPGRKPSSDPGEAKKPRKKEAKRPNKDLSRGSKRVYVCPHCQRSYDWNYNLNRHLVTLKLERCPQIPQLFDLLSLEIRVRQGERLPVLQVRPEVPPQAELRLPPEAQAQSGVRDQRPLHHGGACHIQRHRHVGRGAEHEVNPSELLTS